MKLHQRGIDLLVEIQSAIDDVDKLSATEVRDLLTEMETVLRDLLDRDVPVPEGGTDHG